MKDLNRTEVYDIRGITHEQAAELLKWLIDNDNYWKQNHFHSLKSETCLIYANDFNEWLFTSSDYQTTHISTLFEPSYEEQLIEAMKHVEELKRKINEPKVGDWVFMKDRGFKIVTNKNQAKGLFKQGWQKVKDPFTLEELNKYGAN